MKLIKKWLFPALTCLIVAGAAVLPPCVSQARDAGQFWPEHIEELLAADALGTPSPAQAPTLLDRMELYANQYSDAQPILSSSTSVYADPAAKQEQALALRELLVAWGIAPDFFFDKHTGASDEAFEYCSVQRLLLWDPAGERDFREPFCYYLFAWTDYGTYHNKSLSVDVDAETGLPIQLMIWDTDIAQWFPYTRVELADAASRYFEMMGWTVGVDVVPMEPLASEDSFYQLYFSVAGTDLYYRIIHGPTTLNITLCSIRNETDLWGADSISYDG